MTIQEKCRLLAAQTLPRILSQIGRDENVPDYGCCDRNHHHYKIRDFSSIIIQQAGYAAWCHRRCCTAMRQCRWDCWP